MRTYLKNKEEIHKELFALAKVGRYKELIESIKNNNIDIKNLTEPDEFDEFDKKITENDVEEYDWDADSTDIDSQEIKLRDIFEPFQIINYSIDKKQKPTAEKLISFCIKERKNESVQDKYILLKIACMYRLRKGVEDIIESETKQYSEKVKRVEGIDGAKVAKDAKDTTDTFPPSKLLDPKTYPNINVSPLFHACIGEDKKIITSLIKTGFNPTGLTTGHGHGHGHEYILACADISHADAIETLLENYPSKEITSLKDYISKIWDDREIKKQTKDLETILELINQEEKRRKAVLKEKISKKMTASDGIEI